MARQSGGAFLLDGSNNFDDSRHGPFLLTRASVIMKLTVLLSPLIDSYDTFKLPLYMPSSTLTAFLNITLPADAKSQDCHS